MRFFGLALLILLAGCGAGSDEPSVPTEDGQLESSGSDRLFPSNDAVLREAFRNLDCYLMASRQGYANFSPVQKIEWMLMLMSDPDFMAGMGSDSLLSRALELRPETVAGESWDYWSSVALTLKLNEDSQQEQDWVQREFGLSASSLDSAQARSLLEAFAFLNTETSQ